MGIPSLNPFCPNLKKLFLFCIAVHRRSIANSKKLSQYFHSSKDFHYFAIFFLENGYYGTVRVDGENGGRTQLIAFNVLQPPGAQPHQKVTLHKRYSY